MTASQEVEQSGSEGLHLISSAFMSVSTIDAQDAIAIFRAKAERMPRDRTSSLLSEQYGITMKAVRDIWNLRTWAWTTMPFWTKSDLSQFLQKHLCDKCRSNGVQSIASACSLCATPRRRGRPSPGGAAATNATVERVLQDSKAADAMGAAAFSEKQMQPATAMLNAYKPTTPAVRHNQQQGLSAGERGWAQQGTGGVSAPVRANTVHMGMPTSNTMGSAWNHVGRDCRPNWGDKMQMRYDAGYDFEGRDQCEKQQTFTYKGLLDSDGMAQMWACEPPSDSRYDNLGYTCYTASKFHGACDSIYSRYEQGCADVPDACHTSGTSSSNFPYVSRAPISKNELSIRGLDQGGRGRVSQLDLDEPEMRRHNFESSQQLGKEARQTCERPTDSWHTLPVFHDSTTSMISNASTACLGGEFMQSSSKTPRHGVKFDEHTSASIDEWLRNEGSYSMCTAAVQALAHPQPTIGELHMNASTWEMEEQRWNLWSPAAAGPRFHSQTHNYK